MRFRTLLGVTILLLVGAVAWLAYSYTRPLPLPTTPYEFTLTHGSSLKTVSRQLADAGVLPDPYRFELLGRLLGKATQIKAGNYELESPPSALELLAKITAGDVKQSEITFIEGQTFAQMRKLLATHPGVKQETAGLTEAEILKLIGAEETAAEGLFFPATYFFSSGMSDLSILKRAYKTMRAHLAAAWEKRQPGLPYENPYQALIVASIVEKETGHEQERPLIAAVFVNRLRLGMKLQTDPTVIYGMGERFEGNLRKQDLTADTAYNTYTRFGLPPTPIAMPGLASIEAALNPAQSSALYFVSKGDGTHHFSSTLAEHNQAVAKYLLR